MSTVTHTVKQTLALNFATVFLWITIFINLCLLYNKYTRVPLLLYILWIVGPGRRASKFATWPTPLRSGRFWKYVTDYFPADLVKTADLDPSHKYIFTVHPHGIVTLSTWVAFDCDATGFSVKFPGIDIRPLTLNINFFLPIFREILLLHGVCDASKQSCLNILRRGSGSAILLAVGGAAESLLAEPGTYDLILKKRKGFVKVALEGGAHLVPTILFGENDMFYTHRPASGSVAAALQKFFKRALGFTVPIFWGSAWGNPLMPRRVPLNIVTGAPLAVPQVNKDDPQFADLVDKYHAQYMEALQRLWDENKDKYAADRKREMRFVQ